MLGFDLFYSGMSPLPQRPLLRWLQAQSVIAPDTLIISV